MHGINNYKNKRVYKEVAMGGFFGVASKQDCVLELFYGVDYHSHLGTRRGGMAVYGEDGFYEDSCSTATTSSSTAIW